MDADHLVKTRNYYNDKFAHINTSGSGLNSEELARWNAIHIALKKWSGEKKTDEKILDLGCGRGWLCELLSNYGSVTGVDISDESVRSAAECLPGIQFECLDMTSEDLPKKLGAGSFGLIVSSEVIEHTPDQEGYVKNIHALLKKNSGTLLLTTPNGKWKEHYFNGERKDWGQLYEAWLTKAELEKILRPYFKTISIHSFNSEWMMQLNSFGMPHFLGSRILTKAFKILGLFPTYKRMLEKRGYGLYLFVKASYY